MSNMGYQHKPNNITVNFFNTFSPLPMCALKYLIFFLKKKKNTSLITKIKILGS